MLYLDNPLTDHNLLQAIARTNRRYGTKKDKGVVVDYVGVSKKLDEALAAFEGPLASVELHRVIDNKRLVLSGDDLWTALNYQLVHFRAGKE